MAQEKCNECATCRTDLLLVLLGGDTQPFAVFCKRCFGAGPDAETQESAIHKWNGQQSEKRK